jgi:hypothetical protein
MSFIGEVAAKINSSEKVKMMLDQVHIKVLNRIYYPS